MIPVNVLAFVHKLHLPSERIEWRESNEKRSAKSISLGLATIALFANSAIYTFLGVAPPLNLGVSWGLKSGGLLLLVFALVVSRWRWVQSFSEFCDRVSIENRLKELDSPNRGPRSNEHSKVVDDGVPNAEKVAVNFESLWHETQERLSIYHKMATSQSAKSYRNSQGAIVAGFVVLISAVIFSSFTSSTGGAIAAGGIAAVGAALTGYLTRTFMRMHESSSRQLRSYFDQPLDLSRSLAAERLLSQIPDEARRADAVVEIIRRSYRVSDARVDDSSTKGSTDVQEPTSKA
jgi:hypothetical protein